MAEDQDRDEQRPVADNRAARLRPPITCTTHTLPFDQLSWHDFERLCLALLPREGFDSPQHYGAAGSEQGRDIVARRDGELWYVQCKRVKECGPQALLDEVEKVRRLMESDPNLRPAGMLFIASCDVSAAARDRVGKRCAELGLACEVWGRTDLDARVQPHSDIVRTFFSWYTRPVGIPFQAPPLPPHFVPRPEVSDALKTRLLTDEATAPGVLVVSAIHGLGGIGKSVLAAALAHDPEVQARFPDGVLWAILGQQPEILSLLSSWIQTLGDYDFHPTTVEAASAHLRTLLHNKAALLVVDDVWDPDHARPFQIVGPRCQVLITTRRADVADEVGADLYQLDVMTPRQSLHLLSARLGRSLAETEQEEALLLADAVGHLPLALELAAARVARGTSWATLCDALEQEIAHLEALEGPRRRRKKGYARLEASFNLSLNALRGDDEEAWRAFVWLGVLPEDVAVAAPMAAILWEMDHAEASEMLELLWNDALLLPGPLVSVGERTWSAYRLHDLLHDMACRLLTADQPQGLGFTLPQAHAALLERYLALTRDGLWHTLPDDNYIHAHLTWHMERAGWADELHTLLREETVEGRNGWYEARERLRQTAGYLSDVTRAWWLADARTHLPSCGKWVARGVRCALINASLNSLAGNIPPPLLAVLVEKEVWTPAQGLVYARQRPDAKQRVYAMVELVPQLPEPLLQEALATAREIESESLRAEILARLAPRLPMRFLGGALATAQAIQDGKWRAVALVALAPNLPEYLLQEALAAAQAIQDGKWRAVALVALAPNLPGHLLQEALVVVRTTKGKKGKWSRAIALTGLAPHLSEPLRGNVLQEALNEARTIRNRAHRAQALVDLAPHLLEPERTRVLREALVAAQEIRDKQELELKKILMDLAPHLPDELLQEALALARRLPKRDSKNRSHRIEVLVALAPHLPGPEREQAIEEALTVARKLEQDCMVGSSRAEVLARLAIHLPRPKQVPVLREALDAGRAIQDKERQAGALAAVALNLPEPERERVFQEALTAARAIEDRYFRVEALARLVLHLPERLQGEALTEALAAAERLGDERLRTEALAKLVPHLSGRAQREALIGTLAAARKLGDERWCAEVLTGLVSYLPETLLQEMLTAIQEIQDKDDWLRRLARLTPHPWAGLVPHPVELLPREEVVTALEIGWKWVRAQVLVALALRLVELGRPREALVTARAIWDESDRAKALAALASRLAKVGYPYEAWEAVRVIRDKDARAKAMAKLAPYLSEALLRKAVAAVREIKDANDRAWAIAGIVPHLAEPLKHQMIKEALAAVRATRDEGDKVNTLTRLAPYLSEMLLREALAVTQEILWSRDRVLAMAGIVPHLTEPLKHHVIKETLAAVRMIGDKSARAGALARLATCLAEPLKEETWLEALTTAREIEDESARAGTLVGLIPYLPEVLKGQTCRWALTAAQEIEDANERAKALTKLALHLARLSAGTLAPLWQETLPILAACTRRDLLSDLRTLAPVIHKLGGEEAIAETFRAIQDVGRWWP